MKTEQKSHTHVSLESLEQVIQQLPKSVDTLSVRKGQMLSTTDNVFNGAI